MAEEWIKMTKDLADKPEVRRLARLLGVTRYDIIGRLQTIWSWADTHSLSGKDMDISEEDIDDIADLNGFAAALRQVGWLRGRAAALEFPNFDRHNGQTAKRRAMEQLKKSRQRKERDNCPLGIGTFVPQRKNARLTKNSAQNATQSEKLDGDKSITYDDERDKCPDDIGTTSGLEKKRIYNTPLPPTRGSCDCGEAPCTANEVEKPLLSAAMSGRVRLHPEQVADCAAAYWHARDAMNWLKNGCPVRRWQSDAVTFAISYAQNHAAPAAEKRQEQSPAAASAAEPDPYWNLDRL